MTWRCSSARSWRVASTTMRTSRSSRESARSTWASQLGEEVGAVAPAQGLVEDLLAARGTGGRAWPGRCRPRRRCRPRSPWPCPSARSSAWPRRAPGPRPGRRPCALGRVDGSDHGETIRRKPSHRQPAWPRLAPPSSASRGVPWPKPARNAARTCGRGQPPDVPGVGAVVLAARCCSRATTDRWRRRVGKAARSVGERSSGRREQGEHESRGSRQRAGPEFGQGGARREPHASIHGRHHVDRCRSTHRGRGLWPTVDGRRQTRPQAARWWQPGRRRAERRQRLERTWWPGRRRQLGRRRRDDLPRPLRLQPRGARRPDRPPEHARHVPPAPVLRQPDDERRVDGPVARQPGDDLQRRRRQLGLLGADAVPERRRRARDVGAHLLPGRLPPRPVAGPELPGRPADDRR